MRRLVLCLGLLASPALAGHEFDGRDISNGAALYSKNCAACHGAALEGQPDWQTPDSNGVYPAPPHDEDGHTWHHSNAQLFDYTQQGGQAIVEQMGLKSFVSGMPAFGDSLSDDEIWDILAYIRSTWPERIRELQAGRNPPHD